MLFFHPRIVLTHTYIHTDVLTHTFFKIYQSIVNQLIVDRFLKAMSHYI